MKYVFHFGIFLTFAILFTTSSGILKAEAYSDYNEYRIYQEDDLYNYGEKSLYELDNEEFLEGIDDGKLLDTTLNLLEELDFNKLNEQLLLDFELNPDDSRLITFFSSLDLFLSIIISSFSAEVAFLLVTILIIFLNS